MCHACVSTGAQVSTTCTCSVLYGRTPSSPVYSGDFQKLYLIEFTFVRVLQCT